MEFAAETKIAGEHMIVVARMTILEQNMQPVSLSFTVGKEMCWWESVKMKKMK